MKAWLVVETLTPGITVNAVAQRCGVPANHVSTRRTLARKGRLVPPEPKDPVEFAPLMIGPFGDGPRCAVGVADRPEIVVGTVVTCLEAGVSA